MRSHLINNSKNNKNKHNSNSAENDEKLIIISSSRCDKLSSFNNGGIKITASPSLPTTTTTCFEAGVLHPGYGLRENPKKTWRIADSSTEDTNSFPDKFCKECGKAFLSWKALFGHMKCHSEKERISNSFEEQDSWTNGNHQKLVMDSQSDNETATTAPNRRRRSRRRKTRYLGTTSNSPSFSALPNASSSVNSDADEQEQEEMAMCLMMLSRDVGSLKSVAESSDNSSVFLETPPISKTSKITIFDAKETAPKLKKLLNGRELRVPMMNRTESSIDGFRKNLSRMNRTESSTIDGFFKKDKIMKKSKMDGIEAYFGKGSEFDEAADLGGCSNRLNNPSKRKIHDDDCEPELRSDSLKKLTNYGSGLDSEIRKCSQKRSRFECTTCNKIFHSYQALGGHRASHKKIKGCFASKIDSSENSIEADVTSEPIAAESSKPIKHCKIENNSIDHERASGGDEKADQTSVRSKKTSKGHECPICLKVFSSGQALGGHKRSHLIGVSEARNNQTIVIQKPIPEIRDFLDLNLPAPADQEENNGGHVDSLKPWWVGNCSHKHERLVGLISN